MNKHYFYDQKPFISSRYFGVMVYYFFYPFRAVYRIQRPKASTVKYVICFICLKSIMYCFIYWSFADVVTHPEVKSCTRIKETQFLVFDETSLWNSLDEFRSFIQFKPNQSQRML